MASLSLYTTCPLPVMAESIAWHGNLACFAAGADVHVVDVGSKCTVAVLRGPRSDRIDILLAASSHALLVCLTRQENVLVYNLHNFSLMCSLSKGEGKDGDGNGFAAACVSSVHPFVFFSRHGSKMVFMLDLTNQRITGKFDGKKTVTCLTAHPSKPSFASGHIDGSVRLWDYQLGSSKLSEEYNGLAMSSAKLAPSPFGITSLTLSGDLVLAASPIGLVVAFKVSNRGFVVVAARVLNGSRGTANLGVLTSIEFHGKSDFFLSCFGMGKIQSWRIVGEGGPSAAIVRSADVSPADYMHLLRGAYKSTLPAFMDLPVLRDFVVRRIVFHPTKFLVAFSLEERISEDVSVSSERLHPIFDMTSSYNPNVPRVPAATVQAIPLGGSFAPAGDVYFVKRGQLILYSVQSNENVVLRAVPEMNASVHPTRVQVSSPSGAVIVQVEKVEAPGTSPASASLSLSGKNKLEPEKLAGKRVATSTSVYLLPKNGSSWDGFEARDAVFMGKDLVVVLDRQGLSVSVVHQTHATGKAVHSGWDAPLERMFNGPPESDLLVYFSWQLSLLCFSFDAKCATPFWPNLLTGCVFSTRKKESVVQLEWQSFNGLTRPVCFVVTTERLVLLDDRLQLLAQLECIPIRALWCGPTVLFSRRESCTVDYFCLDGHHGTLCSTDSDADSSVCGVFRDRLIFVAPSLSDAQIKSAIVWPFECVAHGILGLGMPVQVTEELLKGAMAVLDHATCVSRGLLERLIAARAISACRHILAAAPASLCARLIEDGLWTEAAPAVAPLAAHLLVPRPDHPEALMVQRLDFYRGTAFKPAQAEEVKLAAPPTAAASSNKALPVPVGFFPLEVRIARLPSVGTSTYSSCVLSMEMKPARPPLVTIKTTSTPALPMRKPAPRSALPEPPSESSSVVGTPVAVSSSPHQGVALAIDDGEDEEEDARADDSSDGGSPLLTNRASVAKPADHFSQVPFEMRSLTDSIVIPTDPVASPSGKEDLSLVSTIHIGSVVSIRERGDAVMDETISLYEMGMLKEAFAHGGEALECFANIALEGDEALTEKIRKCAAYKVLFLLLLRRAEHHGSALLSTLAACVCVGGMISAEHKKPVVQEAIRDNLKAKNFRVASSLFASFSSLLEPMEKVEENSDAQEWCSQFMAAESTLFCVASNRILTSSEPFRICKFCGCASSVVQDPTCLICGKRMN
jgi:WD40 repeat protein